MACPPHCMLGYTPGRHPLWQNTPSPPRWPLQLTVRILLEYILVISTSDNPAKIIFLISVSTNSFSLYIFLVLNSRFISLNSQTFHTDLYYFRKQFLQLYIFIKELNYEITEQQKAVELGSLLGEIGGFLGDRGLYLNCV